MIALTDEFTGAIVESYAYGPFGASDEVSGAGNPYRFTGRRLDDETGFYHYRARVYSVALGRFLQPDPAGFADGLNLYAYVANDPMNFIDPMGLGRLGRDGFFTGSSNYPPNFPWPLARVAYTIQHFHRLMGGVPLGLSFSRSSWHRFLIRYGPLHGHCDSFVSSQQPQSCNRARPWR